MRKTVKDVTKVKRPSMSIMYARPLHSQTFILRQGQDLEGSRIIREEILDENGARKHLLWYNYDGSGQLTSVEYDGVTYLYKVNQFGDVLGLYNESGELAYKYLYDPWGKLVWVHDKRDRDVTDEESAALRNPFRYRGYYYDSDTGWYYLNSRYYDPETGRFLNADGYASTGQGIIGNNMFAYCNNNPVMLADYTGNMPCDANNCYFPDQPSHSVDTCRMNAFYATYKPPKKPSVPSGGETVHKGGIRICTDGSDGKKVPDENWYPQTAYTHNNKPLDAYSVPYIVIPIDDNSAKLGDSALLINHDTNMSVMCVIGERGPTQNGWGEVSIAAIWDTGNPDHKTANHTSGLSTNYEIIIYPGVRYEWGD